MVARRQRLAYVQIPKVACTSMRSTICMLNHPKLPREEVFVKGVFKRHPEWDSFVAANHLLESISDTVRGRLAKFYAADFANFGYEK